MWHEFAAKTFELAPIKIHLAVAAPDEFPSKVPRPNYSMLENNGHKTLGLNAFHTWKEGTLQLACWHSMNKLNPKQPSEAPTITTARAA
jgi:dTDP-4-dehydrorhamnose reductase